MEVIRSQRWGITSRDGVRLRSMERGLEVRATWMKRETEMGGCNTAGNRDSRGEVVD